MSNADTCSTVEYALDIEPGFIRKCNRWVDIGCSNLQNTRGTYGSVICVEPQGGIFTQTGTVPGVTSVPSPSTGYTNKSKNSPQGSIFALGTMRSCEKWYLATEGDLCTIVCVSNLIPFDLFLAVNPSLFSATCSEDLQAGMAYCVGPVYGWDNAHGDTEA